MWASRMILGGTAIINFSNPHAWPTRLSRPGGRLNACACVDNGVDGLCIILDSLDGQWGPGRADRLAEARASMLDIRGQLGVVGRQGQRFLCAMASVWAGSKARSSGPSLR